MDNTLSRLEELLIENRKLYKYNLKLKEEISILNKNLIISQTNISTLNSTIYNLEKEIRKLEGELKTKDKKIESNILFMKNEFKRKDILNNKLVGTNKSTKEMELKKEINSLYNKNNILLSFIKNLFDKKELDFDIFYKILEVSDETNLDNYIENLIN